MSSSGRREMNAILRELEKRGCTVRATKSSHWVVSYPGKKPVTLSGSPSDARWRKNSLADIKRNLGIELH